MLYFTTRMIAIAILALAIYFIMKIKKVKIKFRGKIVLLTIYLFFLIVLLIFPLENLIGFSDPTAAFRYLHPQEKVLQSIKTESGCFIVYGEDGSSISTTSINRKNNKWKILNPYFLTDEKNKAQDNYIIHTLRSGEKTLILIIEGNLNSPKSNLNIEDNRKSAFKSFPCKYRYENRYSVVFYTVINSNDRSYRLTVDGHDLEIT